MYRLGLRQLANASRSSVRAFSSRSTSRVAAARRTGATFAIAAPLLAYGLYQYSSIPIMNEEKNEITEEEITITPNLLDERDLSGDEKKDEKDEKAEGDDDESSEGTTGAFNPETGEINWDCPCLGGMAEGPCGEEFKAAFSCFVYSEVEPKGADCIEKFSHMQDCFRKYPEVYSEQLRDEDPLESPTDAEIPAQESVEVVETIAVEEALPQTDAVEPKAEITKKD